MKHFMKEHWRAALIIFVVLALFFIIYWYRYAIWQPKPSPGELMAYQIVNLAPSQEITDERYIVVADGWRTGHYEYRTSFKDGAVLAQRRRHPLRVLDCSQRQPHDVCRSIVTTDGTTVEITTRARDGEAPHISVRAMNRTTEFYFTIPNAQYQAYAGIDWERFFDGMRMAPQPSI